ncbi:hypothetical protein ACI3LY_003365 [Candidozyma auris]|uniref:Pyridoxamine 5'-phosphate oxidase N-terminal domain-containing protein n=1 Tax=Candidozyma auris TaxID=498019 RepID=A0A2H0ZUQ5_CANAR|nr:hypothetical_protein [[Candida] auris]KNE02692.2 hypothetical protein QG37_00064 [[Candida] auris]PIS52446.1 hypothetical protein B9J08_004062 [[Candida] auris]PIS54427.1 hypothetical protein CJI97_004130 [[Candida] auris]PSK79311.1 hypothetical protein CJJ07_000813 [[Candida] auris]QEO21740.1 hypothetical_protein [[Candida] auris]
MSNPSPDRELRLPEHVTKLLKSKRYVHLATAKDNVPHASLMNYTYYSKNETPYIILSTPRDTTKYRNIESNPHVSLLIHDWVAGDDELAPSGRRNSLYELLANMNKAEIRSVSVMLNGRARIIDPASEDYKFYKSLHLNNTLVDEAQAETFIQNENNSVVLITVDSCQITNTNNEVQTYES